MTQPDSLPIEGLPVARATLPLVYGTGLEYSPPARGTWTIMHLGLLIPETHIIFVCARCCLRGVSMSAAELRALDRFSTITIEDCNLLEGNTEHVLIEGVTDILSHLPRRPKGVFIFTSCVHEFIGSDLTFSFETLRRRFPDIVFTDGYMTPILRKRITPDQRNRRQIYTMLNPAQARDDGVTLAGEVRPVKEHSDYRRLVENARRPWRQITQTRTWREYQDLARSGTVLTLSPFAAPARRWMSEHLGQTPLALSTPWTWDEIRCEKAKLCTALGVPPLEDDAPLEDAARHALHEVRRALSNAPLAIDYTATTRPLSLARLLLAEGFNVRRLYVDAVAPNEKADFEWLQVHQPQLMLHPTVSAVMVGKRPAADQRVLALGQKAAWFEHTDRFVNMVEGDGADGLRGILRLAERMNDAWQHPKSARDVIQIKALGCTKGGCA